MASNLTVDTLTKGATTLNTDELVDVNNTRVCKAWVNFNGSGTVAIRASYNVSSIVDNGTGLYTVNFTTAMPDTNYSYVASGAENLSSTRSDLGVNASSSNVVLVGSIKISTVYASTSALFDANAACVAIYR